MKEAPTPWHIYYWLLFLKWKYMVIFKLIGTKPVPQELYASPHELMAM